MVSAAICELGLYSDPYSQEMLIGKVGSIRDVIRQAGQEERSVYHHSYA